MAVEQTQQFTCTVTAGTAIATPTTFQCQLNIFQVDWVEVTIWDGPGGCVGFYLASSGNQIFPRTPPVPNWVVADGVTKRWDVIDQPTSGDWQLVAYNTGFWPHTLYVVFGLEPTTNPTSTSSLIIDPQAISSAPSSPVTPSSLITDLSGGA